MFGKVLKPEAVVLVQSNTEDVDPSLIHMLVDYQPQDVDPIPCPKAIVAGSCTTNIQLGNSHNSIDSTCFEKSILFFVFVILHVVLCLT
jgi:hypothetical protein